MGASGLGPFDNDSALDFIDEFLEVESPAGALRKVLAQLDSNSYHEIDEVHQAWAACELVAIVSSNGEGLDPDDVQYEAAARLRPNKKLVEQCLKALPHILDENSELSDLLESQQRAQVEEHIANTSARLKRGMALNKFPRLKVPKIKAVQVYAVAAKEKWVVVLYDYSNMLVLDAIYDELPDNAEQISLAKVQVLFNCRYLGPIDDFSALGRLRPSQEFIDSNEYVTIIRTGCGSGSDHGGFESNYWLNRGQKFSQQHYDDVRTQRYCPELYPEQFAELIDNYVSTNTYQAVPVPTPAELRDEYLQGCQREWARYLEGEGGGPFSFPNLYRMNVAPLILPWIKLHVSTEWTNAGMCLPDDLHRYFLAGLIAASIEANAESEVPENLIPILKPLKSHIGAAEIEGAIHVLSCVLDEGSVIPYVLRNDQPRQRDFLAQAGAIRAALKSKQQT